MKSIYTAFRRLLSSSLLLPIVFLFQCDDSDKGKETVVCTKDLRIVKLLPNRNPIAAPILIIGKSFSNSTKVTFNDIESEISDKKFVFFVLKEFCSRDKISRSHLTIRVEFLI